MIQLAIAHNDLHDTTHFRGEDQWIEEVGLGYSSHFRDVTVYPSKDTLLEVATDQQHEIKSIHQHQTLEIESPLAIQNMKLSIIKHKQSSSNPTKGLLTHNQRKQ